MASPRICVLASVAALCAGGSAHARAGLDATLAQDLARLQAVHGGTVLVLSADVPTLRGLARRVEREGANFALRSLSPTTPHPIRTAELALGKLGLRCAAIVDPDAESRLVLAGSCGPDSAVQLSETVPRVTAGGRGDRIESDATLSVSPALVSGKVADLSLEVRQGRKAGVQVSATRAEPIPDLNIVMMGIQVRRYWIGDFDNGLYGLAQFGGIHADGPVSEATLGIAREGTSPMLGAGLGLKLSLPGGLTADGHLGLAAQTLAPVAPLAGMRLGWSW